ncbi:Anaphase-promoting complex subunit 8 [Intoshia linei]|uniref:Anaphase-promoting complex subunit 8 n=1 Tax=Intoshia linei TaxID=1819745 RepID=A0A177B3B4_9BILA|nr:Anaphase-promoting complex subunit 8 [Intoshia linei]
MKENACEMGSKIMMIYDQLFNRGLIRGSESLSNLLNDVDFNDQYYICDWHKSFKKGEFVKFKMIQSYIFTKEYARVFKFDKTLYALSSSNFFYFTLIYCEYLHILMNDCFSKSPSFDSFEPKVLGEVNVDIIPRLNHGFYYLHQNLNLRKKNVEFDAYIYYLLGLILNKLKRNDEAIKNFILAVQMEPYLQSAWHELEENITNDKYLQCLNAVQDCVPKWVSMIKIYTNLNLIDKSFEIFDNYLEKFKKNVNVALALSNTYAAIMQNQQSKDILVETIERFPYCIDVLDSYSNLLFISGDFHGLLECCKSVVHSNRYSQKTCCILGNYYSLIGHHKTAIVYFRRAIRICPTYIRPWILLGHEYLEERNVPGSVFVYRRALELCDDHRAYYGLGQAYEIAKMYSYALMYYQLGLETKPNDFRFIQAMADLYTELNKIECAKKCYWKIYLMNNDSDTLFKLAKLFQVSDERLQAASVFSKYLMEVNDILEKDEDKISEAYLYLAKHYLIENRLDDAYEAAHKVSIDQEQVHRILKDIASKKNALNKTNVTAITQVKLPINQKDSLCDVKVADVTTLEEADSDSSLMDVSIFSENSYD